MTRSVTSESMVECCRCAASFAASPEDPVCRSCGGAICTVCVKHPRNECGFSVEKIGLARADYLLGELQNVVRNWHRPTSWDVAGVQLQNEACGRLEEARQILHALAELEAVAHNHAKGCVWQPGGGDTP